MSLEYRLCHFDLTSPNLEVLRGSYEHLLSAPLVLKDDSELQEAVLLEGLLMSLKGIQRGRSFRTRA